MRDIAKEYYISGDYPKALTYYERVLAIYASDTGALNDKGNALYALGNPKEEFEDYWLNLCHTSIN